MIISPTAENSIRRETTKNKTKNTTRKRHFTDYFGEQIEKTNMSAENSSPAAPSIYEMDTFILRSLSDFPLDVLMRMNDMIPFGPPSESFRSTAGLNWGRPPCGSNLLVDIVAEATDNPYQVSPDKNEYRIERIGVILRDFLSTTRSINIFLADGDDLRCDIRLVAAVIANARANLTTLKLHLSSETHSYFCRSSVLFNIVGLCEALESFSLLLTQLPEKYLVDGVKTLGISCPSLRKLCLINSVASNDTLKAIGQTCSNLTSLGLINCWFVQETALLNSVLTFAGCQLSTLNVSYTKGVKNAAVRRLIDRNPFDATIKLYTKFSGVNLTELIPIIENEKSRSGKRILIKELLDAGQEKFVAEKNTDSASIVNFKNLLLQENRKRRRLNSGDSSDQSCCSANEIRCSSRSTIGSFASEIFSSECEDWEYDSDLDFLTS